MESISGIVLDIQRSSMYDGPGIRTAVFLKGCPLSCAWCHNPESQSSKIELGFFASRCTGCGKCASVCENGAHVPENGRHVFRRERCTGCGNCVKKCRASALKLYGRVMTAQQVVQIAEADRHYYANSGGLTVSGGEPFAQFDFLRGICLLTKQQGISTCVETSGFTSTKRLREAMGFVDHWLFDYKITDSALHKQVTGVGNEIILNNLKLLHDSGTWVRVRCPIIPGINDTPEHFAGIAALEKNFPHLNGIELLPYHDMGLNKASAIGYTAEYAEATATQQQKDVWKEMLRTCGCSESVCSSF